MMCWGNGFFTGGGSGMFGMMSFMGIGMLFWIVIVALVAYFLFQFLLKPLQGSTGYGQPDDYDAAIRILKERYARGEIDNETFHRMKEELK